MRLTEEQHKRYERDGFLVFSNLFSREEAAGWLRHLEELARDDGRSEAIRIQIEPAVERGEAEAEGLDAVRKVECLVANDPVFLGLARDPRLLEPLTELLGPDIKLFRDALMMKPAHHGSAKPY